MRRGGWVFGLVFALAASTAAHAIPAFARKYDVPCSTCHAGGYPELNLFGRQFLENGYQFPGGAEAGFRERTTKSPGTIGERLALWRELPFALRAQSAVVVPTHASASGRNAVDLRMIENLFLLAGGSFYRDASFFAAVSLPPSPGLHHATLGVHNLFFGEGRLNVRAGQLLLFDFLRPEHRSSLRAGNLVATARVGLNPTALDTSHLGIDVYGRLFERHLFYQLALVQGAQGPDGLSDLDGNKDVFGQLQGSFLGEQSAGAFGYYGRTQLTDRSRAVVVRFTDPFWILGAHVDLRWGLLNLYVQALFGRHENPRGLGTRIDYGGLRAGLTAVLTSEWVAVVRYDRVLSRDDLSLEKEVLAAQATYLLLSNLKLSVELDVDFRRLDQSTAFARLDLAL